MSTPPVDRRRYPRHPPGEDIRLELPVTVNAEVLDISGGGAQISTTAPLLVGQRAQLRMLLDRQPFTAWFEVKRVEMGTQTSREHRYRVAAQFISIDERNSEVLRQFLRE